MTLDEFDEIYNTSGEVAAALLVSECDCDLAQFVEKYPQFSKLWVPLSIPRSRLGTYWAVNIALDIDLFDSCPIEILEGSDWTCILCIHPTVAHACNWSLLELDDWSNLLEHQPQLIKFK